MKAKQPPLTYSREYLNNLVVNIEFLLISVVQGVALATLATSSLPVITNGEWEYIPYVISGFLIILTFWSQAIIHTLSFIDWPLDMFHNFFYFLIAFVEVLLFSEITNPQKWFALVTVFFVIAAVLYTVDLFLIKKHKRKYDGNSKSRAIYEHIYKRQLYEMKVLIPSGFIFNLVSFFLISKYPTLFITHHYHLILIFLQIVFGLVALADSTRGFQKRSKLISSCMEN